MHRPARSRPNSKSHHTVRTTFAHVADVATTLLIGAADRHDTTATNRDAWSPVRTRVGV